MAVVFYSKLSPAEDGAEGERESWGSERREASWAEKSVSRLRIEPWSLTRQGRVQKRRAPSGHDLHDARRGPTATEQQQLPHHHCLCRRSRLCRTSILRSLSTIQLDSSPSLLHHQPRHQHFLSSSSRPTAMQALAADPTPVSFLTPLGKPQSTHRPSLWPVGLWLVQKPPALLG